MNLVDKVLVRRADQMARRVTRARWKLEKDAPAKTRCHFPGCQTLTRGQYCRRHWRGA